MPKFKINHWRTDPHGWVGALVMLLFGGIAYWRWQTSGSLFFALTCLRDVAASWFLLSRRQSSAEAPRLWNRALAYVSSAMPFAYLNTSGVSASFLLVSNLLAIFGFTLATVALFELGNSFGVAAANRGRVRSGVYKILSHPMYVGYAIAEFGQVILNPWNAAIFCLSVGLYFFRACIESKELLSQQN